MHTLRNIFLSAVAAAALFTGNDATAQPPCLDLPPIGDTVICTFLNGQKILVTVGGTDIATTSGQAVFQVIGHSYNPCQAILGPVSFFSSGNSPRLGPVNTSLAAGTPPTTITGGNATLFPGDLNINLNLRADIGALGPLNATSTLRLYAGRVFSIHPRNVRVDQLEPVDFADESGTVRATLIGTNVTLNGDGN